MMNRQTLEATMIEQVKLGEVPPILQHLKHQDERDMILYILIQKAAGRKSIKWADIRARMGWSMDMNRKTMQSRYVRAVQGLCETK